MTQKRRFSLFALAAVALLAVGCQPLANIGEKWNSKGEHYIKLVVNAPNAGRAISVTDFAVTRLAIAVHDPDGALLRSIDWDPTEGAAIYMVPVEQTGDHEITVTHYGEHDGDEVEATESRTVTIAAMVITEISIVPGSIGVIHVQGDDSQPVAEDGTLTLHFTGIEAPDGIQVLVGIFSADMDPANPMPSVVAYGGGPLAGGGLDSTAHLDGTFDPWEGEGGTTYMVFIWVDMNNNVNTVMQPEPGIDLQLITFPLSVEINGNIDLSFTGENFITVPTP